MATSCDACFQACKPLLCARCRLAQYCSKECQAQHYKVHKYICRAAKLTGSTIDDSLAPCVVDSMLEALAAPRTTVSPLFQKLIADQSAQPLLVVNHPVRGREYVSNTAIPQHSVIMVCPVITVDVPMEAERTLYCTDVALEHFMKTSVPMIDELPITMPAGYKEFPPREKLALAKTLYLHRHAMVMSSCGFKLGVTRGGTRRLEGIAQAAALFSHGCRPNVAYFIRKSLASAAVQAQKSRESAAWGSTYLEIVFVSLRRIEKNEPLFIGYGPCNLMPAMRGFTCDGASCFDGVCLGESGGVYDEGQIALIKDEFYAASQADIEDAFPCVYVK